MTDGTYTDLFGNVCRWKDLPAPERKAKYKPHSHGWAGHPGQGPPGKTCKDCEFKFGMTPGNKKVWKCLKVKHLWTRSINTDITLKTPACEHFEAALSKTQRRLGLGLRGRSPLEIKPLP